MNFFESQDIAKRNTGKLIFLFLLAIVSLIVVTNVLVMFLLGFSAAQSGGDVGSLVQFDVRTFLLIGAAVTGVILLGSLYKISSLSGGGARVAEMMNGRLLVSGSRDLHEQRVLNVVEEMAIASGTPVPPVYLMEESGINAFAAGYSPSDAVIGVTRGTIETLSRDQLQGVIAHEFSHILHGDMRINIRLIGILHGIMVLGIIGFHLMRGGAYSSMGRRSSKDSGGIIFLGLGLMVVGFVGTFFGNLIKAAVSRQREFLADASAVQFTRNPDGIAGALMQISKHSERSYLKNPSSSEISHTLFEEATASSLSGLYATHPPLETRIAAILPNWDGDYSLIKTHVADAADKSESTQKDRQASQEERKEKLTSILTGAAAVMAGGMNTDTMIKQMGNPDSAHLQYADALLHEMPAVLRDAAHEPSSARGIIYFLVLSPTEPTRQQQLDFLYDCADTGVHYELQSLLKALGESAEIKNAYRLPLALMALPNLRQLSQHQYALFKENFNQLIALDKKIDLFEWSLQKIVFHHLDAVYIKGKTPKLGKKSLKKCAESSCLLLSILAQSNKQQGISAEDAYAQGAEKLGLSAPMLAVSAIGFEALNAALDQLTELQPLQKPLLLKACIATVRADQEVVAIEGELVRAIAATIDCPMPPLLA